MEKVGAVVVGGGAVGTAVVWQLAEAGVHDLFLLERNPSLCEEQSGRSSGVVHAGVYHAEGSLKARLCPAANAHLFEFCCRHGVPCERTGKLLVAPAKEDLPLLEEIRRRAAAAGVPGIRMLTRAEIRESEPNVSVEAGLHVPTTGVVDAAALVHALARLATARGATVLTGFEVVSIVPRAGVFEVTGRRRDGREESFEAEAVVNAAGLWCDVVGKMLEPGLDVRVIPMRGEYVRMDRRRRQGLWLSGANVYPVPEPIDLGGEVTTAVGAHLTPTFCLRPDGTVRTGDLFTVGPEFLRAPSRYFPALTEDDVTLDYAGIMVHLAGHSDWIVRPSAAYPNAVQLLGIDSPGLTCCLELARLVRGLLPGGS